MKRSLFIVIVALGFANDSRAYVLEGATWQFSPVNVQMELSSTSSSLLYPPSFPLLDGSTSWEAVYSGSAGVWNPYMADLQLTTSTSPGTSPGTGDGVNVAYFGTSIAGYALDQNTLALTVIYYDGTTMVEADTAFNSTFPWNSYTGPLLSDGLIDFRRVAIHELGHTIGLGDIIGTNPLAIMDEVVSNLYNLTPDDITGAESLYGVPKSLLPTNPVITYFISYSGDFNGDGRQDILWRNTQTGEVRIWYMNGATILSDDHVANVGLDWKIAGIGDFNGDGISDILWENTVSGSIAIWIMKGDTLVYEYQQPSPGFQWSITGVADLDHNGLADIVWRDVLTGAVQIWWSRGPLNFSSEYINVASLDWNLIGTADLFGDGFSELIWRNQNSGEVHAWQLSGDTLVADVSLAVVPLEWQIAGFGDFNGDGRDDILWRNTTNGSVIIWIMNGFGATAEWNAGTVPLAWQVGAAPNIYGTGLSSVLWSNTVTGQQVIWGTSGGAFSGTAQIGVANPNWIVQPAVGNQ